MDGWTDGWMDERMDGWMDGWMKEWMDERVICSSIQFIFLYKKFFSIFLDIDECNASKQLCDPNAKCINTHSSYYCSCFSGFSGDGKTCDGKYNYSP